MAISTLILATLNVLFKYFAIATGFWDTIFWMSAGEAVFGAGIVCVPSLLREFVALFKRSPGAWPASSIWAGGRPAGVLLANSNSI